MPYVLILGGLAAAAVYFFMPSGNKSSSGGTPAAGGGFIPGAGASSGTAGNVAHPQAYAAASTKLGAPKGGPVREGAKVVQYFEGGYTELWDSGIMKTILLGWEGGHTTYTVVFETHV